MRTISMLVLVVASACATGGPKGSYGVTRAEYAGGTQLIFTNASPARLCELRMTFDEERAQGDNWLPASGLASGESIELAVRPGTYKATWSSCRDGGDKPLYAATLRGELAFEVTSRETQLYAYVADSVAPTKRAPVLTRNYQIVHFQGQLVEPFGNTPARVAKPTGDAFARVERELAAKSGQRAPDPDIQRFEPFDASAYVETPAKKARVAAKPARAKR